MTTWQRLRCAAAIGGVALLAACTPYTVAPTNDQQSAKELGQACCAALEVYPDPMVSIMEPKADESALLNKPQVLRRPYLKDKPEAWDYVMGYLRPLDILLVSDKSQISGYLIPGYFSHSLVYLGTETQLRQRGLWDLPALRPHHDRIRKGEVFFESTPPAVTFSPAEQVFDVDSVAMLRPDLDQSERDYALTTLVAQLGKPFDMRMDLSSQSCLFCAELINLAMPSLSLPQQQAYGRTLIVPDAIAVHAITPQTGLAVVGFVARGRSGVESLPIESMASTIKHHWPNS
ncbi:YiiX/YebB-like N1pC/P60 family cysteine hydrolase [uncultured Pelagimonas sp.]|uniref:YiiX/YebB-like N1pC/P60 family cysteine hydrolase n=1 Tax=uncultured Pelagimonas sp. TaxID=1618102 RepID=UPI002627D5FB|nr:YiiX/YebB-like N1pC/P60 family cysteine hydrolase [uncultured Pelagimonas sp.]